MATNPNGDPLVAEPQLFGLVSGMPDPNQPSGVDYFASDDRFLSGTEISGTPRMVDWLSHADKGVRFAFLKARHAQFVGGHGPWFNLNYPLVKNAGLLRAPYHWLDPCDVQLPANTDAVTSGNWQNAAQFPVIGDPLDFALQQANDFCDQILAQGWGEPGDLPPGVDIEPSVFLTAGGAPVKAVILDAAGRPIFEDSHGNQLGAIVTIGGVKTVVNAAGNSLGPVQNDANGHPVAFTDAAGAAHAGRLRKDNVNDLWQRLTTQQDRINVIVVWLAQVERRLAAAVPGRQAKPVIYSASTWREQLGSPTDNGGAGWDVNHNGMNFHVDNFADYPYWFAQYPANPASTTQLRGFPVTWATVGQTFIWQYAPDPDRNALMRITAVAAGNGPAVRTVTVEEVTDLTPIEQLAGIQRPTAAATLARISPAPVDAAPERSFNLLLIGQGFSASEFQLIAQRLWTDPAQQCSVTDTAPFGALRNSSRVACYADSGTGVFLRIRQTPSNVAGMDDALAIPPGASGLLRDYLPLLKVVGDDGTETTADKVWLQRRQAGAAGTLIAILRNGRMPRAGQPPGTPPAQQPAELYQLDASENYPVPVIAVNVTWGDELWPTLVVRALAQNLGGLRDEFDLPGDGFDHPALELVQSPTPNLIYIDQATGGQLTAGGAVPADLATQVLAAWRLPDGTALDFAASGSQPGPLGGVHLVEGGDGYRHQVLRSDFDCLMRRMPVTVAVSVTGATGQPVRASVAFCRVCREWLEAVLRGGQRVAVSDGVRLETQRIGYDWVHWNTREEPVSGFDPAHTFSRVHTMAVPAGEPKWSMTVGYNPAATALSDLFQVTGVQLAQRPGDPYARAVDILHSLSFTGLSVTYTQRERPGGPLLSHTVVLETRLADALANKLQPPRLDLSSDGGADRSYQLGARLTLAWPFTGQWPTIGGHGATHSVTLFTVEAVLGLVLTGEQDVDPSFPVRGCKILPQLALRIRGSAGLVTTGQPPASGGVPATVSELAGSAVIEAVNAIAPDGTLDPALAPIATGTLGATLVSASNSAMGDSQMAPVASNLLLPASGRKLAGMHVDGTDPEAAFRPFLAGPLAWSWRYDYVRTLIAAHTVVVGAYRASEPKGATAPPAARNGTFTWPVGSAFRFNVHKFPREGDYDALHIHPVDTTGSPVLPLAVSGDLGLVLPMRQGASEGASTFGLPLLGWGPGRLDSGARSSAGAPLVPPNQHVDITVDKVSDGMVRVTYGSIAQDFRANDWQVFLEQGLAIGYRYDVSTPAAMSWLRAAASLAGVPVATMQALASALADTAQPAALDLQVRSVFRVLHAGARPYDQQADGTSVQQVPEAGDAAGAEAL